MKMNIRNKMLIWFLSMGLIPILLIAVIAMVVNQRALADRAFSQLENVREVKTEQVKAYVRERRADLAILMETVDGLRQAAFNKLQTVQENKKAQILNYFHKIAKDIEVISKSIIISSAMKDFQSVLDSQGEFDTLLYDFFEAEKYGDTLVKFREIYGYHDLLLVTAQGNVVYSSRKGPELGQNIITGKLKSTNLARCFKQGLTHLDFQDFEPVDGSHMAVFGSPVKEKNGALLGVILLKLTPRAINEITLRHEGMGSTGETYLSGIANNIARLRSSRPGTTGAMGDRVSDPLVGESLFAKVKPMIRIKETGESEIAIYEPIPVFGTTYILSTRMALNEVLDPRGQSRGKDYFSKYIQTYGYKDLYLISPGGQVFYSAAGETEKQNIALKKSRTGLARLYQKVMVKKSIALVDFSISENGAPPHAYLGAPLMYNDTIEIIVALKLPIDGFNAIMQTKKGLSSSSDIYLVGPDRLLRSDSFLMPKTFSVANSFSRPRAMEIKTLPVTLALEEKTGTTYSRDYRNTRVLSAYAPLTFMDNTWAIIAEIDRGEAFSSLRVFILLVCVCTLITACLIFLFSLYAAKRFAAPIMILTKAAEKVKNREFNIKVSVNTNDELMLLAEAFNAMTDTVSKYASSLEQKIGQLEKARDELRNSEERFRGLVETTSDWIWEVDQNGCYTYVSPRITDILGYEPREILGKTPFDLMPDLDKDRVMAEFSAILQAEVPFSSLENTNFHKNGSLVNLETSGVPFFNEKNQLLGYRGIDRDISIRKKNEEALLLTESVFTNTIEGIAITDRNGIIQRVNQAFCDITGYDRAEAMGKNPRILKSDRHDAKFYKTMWEDLLTHGQWSGEIWNRRKDGSAYPEWLSISAIRNEAGDIRNFVSLFHDISEKKLKEEQLQFLAFHDPLTKLPNRKLLYDRATVSIRNAKRTQEKMALLYMDLDNFKNINDSYGHPFGDELLIQVKERISSICRESDTFARYGGDEFVIVLNNITHENEVSEFSNRILDLFTTPLTIMDEEIFTSVSIGLAIFPDDGQDLITLEKNADMALYEAKRDGKRRSFHFKQQLKDKMLRKIQLENELRRAVRDFHSFHVVYQPKVDTQTGNIHGLEALIRWRIDQNLVSPVEFIPVAEETNLILPIGEWLMEKTMKEVKKIHRAGNRKLSLSINLSARQFNDENLFETIGKIIEKTQYPPEKLCFEITESIPIEDTETAIKIMKKLSAMGIQLSMDDFGTGYSSLSVLKRFPLNELKIDRSFVQDIPANQDDAAICKTIIHMAGALGFKVVAEGVETQEQLDFFHGNQCHLIQGFFLYKPLCYEDLIIALDLPPSA